MLEKLKALYQKYHSVFWYLVTGGVTTLTNIAVFWALYDLAGAPLQAANVAAWVLAIIVAFCGNKWLAFSSREKGKKMLREAVVFLSMRLLTLGFETVFLQVVIQRCGWNALLAKVIDNIIVIILNYILSKAVVFRKKISK
ncbi:MAG: GtrA family protein [Clostridiales bacterium]|nr:GtrA family protein [Clostridiales bacterium]MDY2834545.1 GtrA family protein [Candidatus Aphodomonas sp.]